MDIRKVTDRFYASPQITEADLPELQKKGIRSIICNRPDGESQGQPTFREIADAAKQRGIEALHIPISGGSMTDADVEAFSQALEEMPLPILGYCRSGMRSVTLWSLSRADKMPDSEILRATHDAGYDMSTVVAK